MSCPPVDSQGRCPHHPFVQMQRLSPRTNGWKVLLDSCPICILDDKSVASSSVCSALVNLNGLINGGEKTVKDGSGGDEKQSSSSSRRSSSRGRDRESRSRGRSQPRTKSSALDEETKLRRSRSNSRVRFCPPTFEGENNSDLSTTLEVLKPTKLVKSSSTNSLPTLSTASSTQPSPSASPVSLLNKDPKYKVCPATMQRQLYEGMRVSTMSMDIDISDKSDDSWRERSDLSSSSKSLLGGGGGRQQVVEKKADDTDKIERPRSYNSFFYEMMDVPTFGTDEEKVKEEDKDTRRSLFKECKDEEEKGTASNCKEEKDNELDVYVVPFPPKDEQETGQNEGKGIMLCMPVTEVSCYFPYYNISLLVHMICSLIQILSIFSFTLSWNQVQQQQLEPPSHDEQLTNHDEPTKQEEICARRLQRYRSREQSRSSRPDPEEYTCQDSNASTEHRGNCKSRPSTPQDDHKSLEPEEEEQDQHTQRRPRRSRRSSNAARNTAGRSSFTYGGNGHQVPPPPPPPPLKVQRQNSAPDLYCPALPQAEQLLNSVATHKSKVSHVIVKPRLDDDTISTLSFMPNHVNTIVNPRQDGDTVSTLTFMDKTSSVIPQRQIPRDPQGQPMHDVNELPLPVKTDGTVISSHSSTYEEDMKQPSVNANTNNYDKKGRCVVHPHIQLRKKKFLKRLSIGASSDKCNSEGGGWKILLSACPECCVDELRRTQQELVATQQQQLCQSVASNQGVTEHRQQQQATPFSGRVATLDMLHRLPGQDGVRALHSSSPHSSSNAPSLHSLGSIDPPSSDHQGSMTRSSSAGSNCVPLSEKIGKKVKKKPVRRPTDETASLTISSSCSSNDQQKQHNSSGTTSRSATSSSKSSSLDSKREKSKSFQRSNSSVGSKSVLSSSTPPTTGQRGTINVSQMQWINPKNNQPGEYTGQVDHNFVPHGHGVMMYSDPSLRPKGGEWENGKYRRSKDDGRSSSSRKSGSRASKSSSHTHKSRRSHSKNRRGTM